DGVAGVDSNGQPDGSAGSVNGPSDGGAVTAHVSPSQAGTTPDQTNPVPVAGGSFGSCADNICEEATTQRQTVYQGGGGAGSSRDVYDYSNKQWDPYTCSSGDK